MLERQILFLLLTFFVANSAFASKLRVRNPELGVVSVTDGKLRQVTWDKDLDGVPEIIELKRKSFELKLSYPIKPSQYIHMTVVRKLGEREFTSKFYLDRSGKKYVLYHRANKKLKIQYKNIGGICVSGARDSSLDSLEDFLQIFNRELTDQTIASAVERTTCRGNENLKAGISKVFASAGEEMGSPGTSYIGCLRSFGLNLVAENMILDLQDQQFCEGDCQPWLTCASGECQPAYSPQSSVINMCTLGTVDEQADGFFHESLHKVGLSETTTELAEKCCSPTQRGSDGASKCAALGEYSKTEYDDEAYLAATYRYFPELAKVVNEFEITVKEKKEFLINYFLALDELLETYTPSDSDIGLDTPYFNYVESVTKSVVESMGIGLSDSSPRQVSIAYLQSLKRTCGESSPSSCIDKTRDRYNSELEAAAVRTQVALEAMRQAAEQASVAEAQRAPASSRQLVRSFSFNPRSSVAQTAGGRILPAQTLPSSGVVSAISRSVSSVKKKGASIASRIVRSLPVVKSPAISGQSQTLSLGANSRPLVSGLSVRKSSRVKGQAESAAGQKTPPGGPSDLGNPSGGSNFGGASGGGVSEEGSRAQALTQSRGPSSVTTNQLFQSPQALTQYLEGVNGRELDQQSFRTVIETLRNSEGSLQSLGAQVRVKRAQGTQAPLSFGVRENQQLIYELRIEGNRLILERSPEGAQ